MLRILIIIIFMVWVIIKLIVGKLSMIMIEGIVECLEILTLQIEEDLMREHQEKEDLMMIEDRPCVISVTTQNTLLKIDKHQMIDRILEVENLYVGMKQL